MSMSADRKSLGMLGLILGGVTAVVMLMACTVVLAHVDGRIALEDSFAISDTLR